MSLSHVTYIARYFLHTTPYVSHSTYYLAPITDPRLPSLIYNSFTSHFSYHVSHSYEIYTLCVPFITFWHISNVACHMLSLAYFMSDNLMHVTYHRLCQDISSYTSPIIITYYIVHITYNMSRNHMTYIWNCLLHITPYVSHSTYYLSHMTYPRFHIASLWSFHIACRISRVTLLWDIHFCVPLITFWHLSHIRCCISHVIPCLLHVR